MLKVCDICQNDFQGEGHICPKCIKIEEANKRKKEQLKIKIKELFKSKLFIAIASVIIVLLFILKATIKTDYNDEAKEIFLFTKENTEFDYGSIDSEGNIYYSSSLYESITKSYKETITKNANDAVQKINDAFPKYKWIVNMKEGYVYCKKNNNSKKIGFYQKDGKEPIYSSIDDCISKLNAELEEDQIKVTKEKEIEELSKTAKKIQNIITAKYMSDGIEYKSICCNIGNNESSNEINKELSEEFSGYWIIELDNNVRDDGSIENICDVYYAKDLESKFVGSSDKALLKNKQKSISELFKNKTSYDCDFITIEEWNKKYSSEIDSFIEERKKAELDALRKKTFKGNRSLDDIMGYFSEFKGNFTEADQTNLQVQSCSVKIKDGEIVIDLSVKSNIEFKKNWTVEIGYYNAAGEREGGCACNMGAIPGLGSDEGEFRGVPNCIDYLKYYRIEHIYS